MADRVQQLAVPAGANPMASSGTVAGAELRDTAFKERLVVGSDHGGFALRRSVVEFLRARGLFVEEVGPETEARVDYPDIAEEVCNRVLQAEREEKGSDERTRGILICGTGIGISITANKIPGIRCALCHDHYTAKMSREHNDANILALGGRVVGPEVANDAVDAFIVTEFVGQHHTARLQKIKNIETEVCGLLGGSSI